MLCGLLYTQNLHHCNIPKHSIKYRAKFTLFKHHPKKARLEFKNVFLVSLVGKIFISGSRAPLPQIVLFL
jgi:hypothetical protein